MSMVGRRENNQEKQHYRGNKLMLPTTLDNFYWKVHWRSWSDIVIFAVQMKQSYFVGEKISSLFSTNLCVTLLGI